MGGWVENVQGLIDVHRSSQTSFTNFVTMAMVTKASACSLCAWLRHLLICASCTHQNCTEGARTTHWTCRRGAQSLKKLKREVAVTQGAELETQVLRV